MITLYRAYSPDGTLLYVGISSAPAKRESTHRRRSEWCTPDVEFVRGETFVERKDALAAEESAIQGERPVHNVQSRGIDRTSPEWRAAVKAAVADAPPVDDKTRARLRAILAVPAGEQPASARTGSGAAA